MNKEMYLELLGENGQLLLDSYGNWENLKALGFLNIDGTINYMAIAKDYIRSCEGLIREELNRKQ